MSDLIRKSELIKEFETQNKVYRPNGLWHITGIEALIENAPTVEAKEVVYGKWVYDENANDWGIGGWRCSECGCKNNNLGCDPKLPVHWFAGSKFCPQCGADMMKKV